MYYKFEEKKNLIITAVIDKLKESMRGSEFLLCAEFIRQFYGTVALDDLSEWSIDNLYGAVINFWSLIYQRNPDETKIRIYNPDFEKHAWQTTHTVIEVITEDMPFLVDSLRMAVNRLTFSAHVIIHMGGLRFQRDETGKIIEILSPNINNDDNSLICEAAVFIEIDRQTSVSVLENIHHNFERVLEDNSVVYKDWLPMREKVHAIIKELDEVAAVLDKDEADETKAFLNWIEDHHFTFLGMRDYVLRQVRGEMILEPLPETGLGVLRQSISKSRARNISNMTPQARELTLSRRAILVMSKTNTESTVHRQAYTDYIGVKRFNKKGEVIGERRFIGLYTSTAYNTSPRYIPFLRHKVALVINNSQLNPRSHAGKVLLNILETFPRDDLIQASEDELLELAMGVYYMQDRRRIRMLARTDVYRRFISCFVYVPKDTFNIELRHSIQKILETSFNSADISFSTWFSESVLARINFIIRLNPNDDTVWDFKEIEQKLVAVGRSWTDDLQRCLLEMFGEEKANHLYNFYKHVFPVAYTSHFSPRMATYDIKHLEALESSSIGMNFYKSNEEAENSFKLKIYQRDNTAVLSDVLPILEHLGMRSISERPYPLNFEDGTTTWINEFSLEYTGHSLFEIDEVKDLFQDAFSCIWFGHAENDGFNQLVLSAGLSIREITVLRAYAKYFKQIMFIFSQEYIESALNNNATIAKKLIKLFTTRFKPESNKSRETEFSEQVADILTDLETVKNLDEDKIIRQYVQVISLTLRTNYYQVDSSNHFKPYLSIKLNSKDLASLPKPAPMFEIFVYSPRFEGVHLRCAKVARGGIRWSDRKEDFRTEILSLMKAQQVKNSLIVPSGAKGGFVLKQIAINCCREEIFAEAIACYKLFIRGLLDLTDNYLVGKLTQPLNVITFDEDDPYLVVAADKGTATFSDFANSISFEYGFWLGDAFASGGSVGYDHKKMGITARGAWVSVKRHFYEMDRVLDEENFTVVGIGDMSGDVFGNGMLLSKKIKLLAAFNHAHIFIDPNPDPLISFQERSRIFNLPRSNWTDYDQSLISKGGGVFSRNAKQIEVNKAMREVFGIGSSSIEPNELIRVILKAKVDLLWSAGIGTFVKAKQELHAQVGDKTNDATRIDANQLRCKIVAEGGNLGFTQLARVEYALNDGFIYTDFIDNAGGVNCSDKEVNSKVLLNSIIIDGDLTEKQRNSLLSKMTNEVAELVLRDNFAQIRAISVAAGQAPGSIELHARYINSLEQGGKLDRALEYLPEEKVLMERKLFGKGLTRPEIAVLFCYSKIFLKEQILASNLPEDSFLEDLLIDSFPKPLRAKFSKQMQNHPLKREIIATKLSNIITNEMGFTFINRVHDETNAEIAAIVRAYVIARSILELDLIWENLDTLAGKIKAEKQTELMMLYVRLLRRVTRWFLRNKTKQSDLSKTVQFYIKGVREFKAALPQVLSKENRAQYDVHYSQYLELGIDYKLAHELAITRALFCVIDIIEVSHILNSSIQKVAEVYFSMGSLLELSWVRSQVISHETENHWEALSREALRDDLDWQQRQLTASIIKEIQASVPISQTITTWYETNLVAIDKWQKIVDSLRSASTLNYTMFFVAIRGLCDLTQITMPISG